MGRLTTASFWFSVETCAHSHTVDIPEHVNVHAAHPVPAYLVGVTPDRISSEDRKQMDLRTVQSAGDGPVCAGEWWGVGGWENPQGTHSGGKAAFCWDLSRVNGDTFLARIVGAAPGRVIYVEEEHDDADEHNQMSVYHASRERAVYTHLREGLGFEVLPRARWVATRSSVTSSRPTRRSIRSAMLATSGSAVITHRTICISRCSAIWGETWGVSAENHRLPLPVQPRTHYLSEDKGKTWTKVDRGVPKDGRLGIAVSVEPVGCRRR